jgi:hypothetical protein
LPVVGFGEDHLDRTDRPWGVDDHQSPRDAPAEGHQHPCAGPRKAHLVDQQPGQQPLRRNGSSGERCGGGVARSPIVASIQPPCTRWRPWPAGCCKNPHKDGVGDGLTEARARSSTTSPGMAAGSCCKLVRTARRARASQVSEPATGTHSYGPLPALRPPWPGGGSCRPR